MKIRFIYLFFALLPVLANAQIHVSGTIKDRSTGELLPYSLIRIDNWTYGGAVATDGTFSLQIPEGYRKLIFSQLNYLNDTVTIPEGKDLRLEIQLTRIAFGISEEVIIRANRDKSGMASSYLGRENISLLNNGRDIPFLLESTPSLTTTSDAGTGIGYTGLRIRGSDATRINVTVDGIPINDAESHQLYWVDMPDLASSTETIEVQRGAGTSTNGPSSFGGSINITTQRPAEKPWSSIDMTGGSFNTLKTTISGGSGLLNGKWNFQGRLSKISSDGYVERGSSNLKSFFVSGGYYGRKSTLRMNVFSGKEVTYQSWYGIPEASLDTNRTFNYYQYDNQVDDYQQDHYQLFYNLNVSKKLLINAALHYTHGKGYYEEFQSEDALSNYMLEPVILGSDTILNSDLIRRKWLNNGFYGTTASLLWKPNGKTSINAGGAYNEYDGDHFGEVIWAQFASNGPIRHRYYFNNGFKTDLNCYTKLTLAIKEKFSFYGDIQYRRVQYRFTGFDNNLQPVPLKDKLDFFNPKAGLTYTLSPGHYSYLSFSTASKEPSRDDYTETSTSSRPSPERLYDLECGYHRDGGKLMFAFNYYLMNYKDQLVLTGQINDVGNYTRTNVEKSYREGIELEVSWKNNESTPKFIATANTTLSRNKIAQFKEYTDDYDNGGQVMELYQNTDIAFSPNLIGYASLSWLPIRNLRIDLTGKYTGMQYLDNSSDKNKSLSPYFTQDFKIHWSPAAKNFNGFELSFSVLNLSNQLYESNGYTYAYIAGGEKISENYYYPQAGRNFLAGISLKF